jgi:hypothetical protein
VTTTLTIGDFFRQTGAQAHYFDLGRRVVEIPAATMTAFEAAELPYPQPFLQAAWLGIAFHYPPDTEHHVWFLRLPLDEQGKLIQAARDDFLGRLMETAGAEASGALDDNPHGFKPRPERMAVFHAKVSRLLGQAPSQYYPHAREYFQGTPGFEQWNFVGLQGIADVAARLDEDDTAAVLARALPHLPATPFQALCGCLENEAIGPDLGQALAARLDTELAAGDAINVAAAIRGFSLCTNRRLVTETLYKVLDSELGRHVEVLAAIAGRAWEALKEPALQGRFLERLAGCEAGQQAFDGILADLLFMPGLREPLWQSLRRPERSQHLAAALGTFLQHATHNAK